MAINVGEVGSSLFDPTGIPFAIAPGEVGSWASFHAACEGVMRRSLAAGGLPRHDQDDYIQDIWLEFLATGLSRYRGGSFPAWLSTLARNKARDHHRRRVRRPVVSLDHDVASRLVEEPADSPDRARRRVWRALADLERRASIGSFLVFYLRWIEGWTLCEVARELGLTPGQARLRHHRMKRLFKDLAAPAPADLPRRRADRPHPPVASAADADLE